MTEGPFALQMMLDSNSHYQSPLSMLAGADERSSNIWRAQGSPGLLSLALVIYLFTFAAAHYDFPHI